MNSFASLACVIIQLVPTGIFFSRRTRAAHGIIKFAAHGMFSPGVVRERPTSTKSTPASFSQPITVSDSLKECSGQSSNSTTPRRTVKGKLSGQNLRTSATVSSKKRARPSREPPYSSERVFDCGERKLCARKPWAKCNSSH
ncbi:hypothetical protein D3C71_1580950 [compost metagenome]